MTKNEKEPRIVEKRWDPRIEKELLKTWEAEKLYEFNLDSGKKVFSIDTPPPYPSGSWHIGAVAQYVMIDMIARYERMRGYEVLFPFGLDRNGLPVETAVEKKHKISMHNYDREKFLKLCREYLDTVGNDILRIAKRGGLSARFDHIYMTDSEKYRTLTQTTFIELWHKGLIYEDIKPSNYCPKCRTTIADAELEYEELDTFLNYLKFKIKDLNDEIIVATTRPELLCACKAILVHPDDERYKKYQGKVAEVPLYSTEVKIIPHTYAKPEFGTGCVMICSYGDQGDVMMFRELGLEPVIAINIEGRMTVSAGKYEGLKVEDARKKIIEDLKEANLLVKQEKTIHRTPVCARSKNPVEFIAMKEFYIKQLDFLDDVRKRADEIQFHPKAHKQILLNWLGAITIDWPITRRRYFATEIPLWYCKKCAKILVPEPGKYYQPWKEKPPFEKCPECGSNEFQGEGRVFDTWMDSSISNLFISGYKTDEKLFSRAYPVSLRPQGRDIVRTWLYYTILRNQLATGKRAWDHAWITGMGLDEHGKKMSKSKGNVIDPEPVLEKQGADSFRLWAASEANVGEDFRVSMDRIIGASKFLTKLWNVARFVSTFEVPEELKEDISIESAYEKAKHPTDKWIIREFNHLLNETISGYEDFNFFVPANRSREFVWSLFAPHYLEMVKARAYEGEESAIFTVHYIMKNLMKLMAPIVPFITDKIYREMYGKSVHREKYPIGSSKIEWAKEITKKIVEFNSDVWRLKTELVEAKRAPEKNKEKILQLENMISEVKIEKELLEYADDLTKMHRFGTHVKK